MIGVLAHLGGGRRGPGLVPSVHSRTTVGSEVVAVPLGYTIADGMLTLYGAADQVLTFTAAG